MKDYKAFTVQHMFKQAQELFGLTPQDIIFPQPGQAEQWQDFLLWCINGNREYNILSKSWTGKRGILEYCCYSIGEFLILFGHQMAMVMLGQILACEPTLDPEAFYFPKNTVKEFLEPLFCPHCKRRFEPNPMRPDDGMICEGCGFTALRSDPETYEPTEADE